MEVLQTRKISRVPESPPNVKGIINFRGEIIPILEHCAMFGLPKREKGASFVIIVLQILSDDEIITIEVVVDVVKGVVRILPNEIKPVPQMSSNINPEFLDGIAKVDAKFLMIMNVDKVFSEI